MTLDREHRVIEFSRERGQLEWTGLAKMRTDRLTPGTGHVYQMLEPLLPIRAVEIHTKEIESGIRCSPIRISGLRRRRMA